MTNGKISNLADPTNPTDAVSLNSIKTYEIITSTVFISSGATDTAQPSCLAGDIATGGGFFTTLNDQPRYVLRSFASPLNTPPPTSWIVTIHNPGPNNLAFNGYVVCLDVTPSPPV
jgi:hypothetical protein